MTRDAFLESLAEFLSLTPAELSDDLELAAGSWDSLAILSVIGLIEEEWSVEVSADRLGECRTVGDLVALVAERLEG